MEKFYLRVILLTALLSPRLLTAQLANGGINAYFGVDADTRSNYVKYGPANGNIASDDWFSIIPSVKPIIDTTNASLYSALLQGGANLYFNKNMSVPLYSKVNGKLWLDAVYGRDYLCTSPLFDTTVFTSAAKNGDNPTAWNGGVSNIPNKNDLVDVYAHMRRDGTSVYDSLWLFTGVSTVGVSGSRYFDIELYRNSFTYSKATGKFTSAGPNAGHTQWLFDPAGNIIQTGDMILAVNYAPGAAPVVDVRIWVSNLTFFTVIPKYFNFGPVLDGATPSFGYVSISNKSGATNFGSGIANYSATPANDTTFSTPWGTETTGGAWGTQYESLQFVEMGLNLTRIGVDPALYTAMGLSPCQPMFDDIFFKSRSSNSFTSNMQDFVEPLKFVKDPIMDYSLVPDTLRCNKSAGIIQINNNSTIGYYTWKTTTGNIVGANSDSTQINFNQTGTYIVSASPAQGCPATRKDTVVIALDNFPPIATANAGMTADFAHLQLVGGDPLASNYPTPFGGSKGLLWDWTGPGAFSANIQNPINDTIWGNYQLIVTEKRNGCKDTASISLSRVMFTILAYTHTNLAGAYANEMAVLKWQCETSDEVNYFEIERSADGMSFNKIGTVYSAGDAANFFGYTDKNPTYQSNWYRVRIVLKDGKTVLTNTINIDAALGSSKYYLARNPAQPDNLSLICNISRESSGVVAIFDMAGRLLSTQKVQLLKGGNTIRLENKIPVNAAAVVTLRINNQLVFADKTVF